MMNINGLQATYPFTGSELALIRPADVATTLNKLIRERDVLKAALLQIASDAPPHVSALADAALDSVSL